MINSQLREGESLFNFKKSEKMLIAMPDPPPVHSLFCPNSYRAKQSASPLRITKHSD